MRDTFDWLASEYDELKLLILPGYQLVQKLALRHTPPGRALRVLELGCGTGEWASMFLDRHPDSEYRAIEFSPNMRKLAAARLSARRRSVRFLDQDLNSPLPMGPFDLIVSFFAIHHVLDKQQLFHQVFNCLSPGGRLIFADITVASDPALEQTFLAGWAAFMRESGLTDERISRVLADHQVNDRPESSMQQQDYLRASGFHPVELIWSWEKFALFYAERRRDPKA
jgi:tRNA (cmo5U34)-methyltransferase